MIVFKARQLISVCESPLVEEGVKRFTEAKKDQQQEAGQSRPYSDPEGYLTVGKEAPLQPSPEKTWKWSGTDFIKSPTEEPWVRFQFCCLFQDTPFVPNQHVNLPGIWMSCNFWLI